MYVNVAECVCIGVFAGVCVPLLLFNHLFIY